MKKTCLLLGWPGYNDNILKKINSFGWGAIKKNKKIGFRELNRYSCIVCYRYKYLFPKELLNKFQRPIINLHISYLPFNRGAHPNFWSFMENTPSGITIHEINEDIDNGDIILQKMIDFKIFKEQKKYTFRNTYKILDSEIKKLFFDNCEDILEKKYKKYKQYGRGSIHYRSQLPKFLINWNQNIFKTMKIYDKKVQKTLNNKLKILNQIENTRKNNNINWMDIVRVGLKNSPEKLDKILYKINNDDNTITELFKKLIK